MGQPSHSASNAIIYCTYAAFLCAGVAIGIRTWRSKEAFLGSLRTQTAFPLFLNFSASAMGAGILFTYPQIGTFVGLQGVLVYALASSLPILTFPPLAARIRKLCPHGFVLTEFVRERFGWPAAVFLSAFSCLTMFIYMISELTSISSVINSLAGLNGLPATIVEVVVTLIYTAVGGLRTSLMTDNIQGVLIILLLVICAVAIGAEVDIDTSLVGSSGLLDASKLGWQLILILPVAVCFNDYFLAGFWQRAFASKTDKDLWWGCIGGAIFIFVTLTLVGVTGMVALWAPGVLPSDPAATDYAFFYLLGTLPNWVVGVCLVFSVALSCAAYDTMQTALVATLSNDLFRNRVNIWWVRLILILNVPAVVIATKNINILVLYLIVDLVSAAIMPPILLGLMSHFYFLRGFDIIIGGLGGFFTVFLFGLVYYDGDAAAAGGLLILEKGLYAEDWSAFGAFTAAPIGSLLWTAGAFLLRWGATEIYCRRTGKPSDVFTRPAMDLHRVAGNDLLDDPQQQMDDSSDTAKASP